MFPPAYLRTNIGDASTGIDLEPFEALSFFGNRCPHDGHFPVAACTIFLQTHSFIGAARLALAIVLSLHKEEYSERSLLSAIGGLKAIAIGNKKARLKAGKCNSGANM
jgi:hypothetical protein